MTENKMKMITLMKYFIFWRIAIFFVLFFSLTLFPLQFSFLGGGLPKYLHNPLLWSWLNFDGEHYFSIAQNGYHPLEYFFFPVYPMSVRVLADIFGRSVAGVALEGIIFSNVSFLIGLVGFIKLIRIDYKTSVTQNAVILLLLFPTSFYFGSFFTESLFFAEVIWALYFARKGQWFYAGFIGTFATGTRIIGVALIPAFVAEAYVQYNTHIKKYFLPFVASLMTLLGLLVYMLFLKERTGDPLNFFTSLNSVFGAQRDDSIVLLPQVFYRYFFKILPNIDYYYFPQVFTTFLELGSGILFFILSVIAFFKLRLSHATYMAFGYLVPTLSGSFSSFPRYALVLFPGFILMALIFENMPRTIRAFVYVISGVLLFVSLSLFIRGYWIS